MDLSLARVEQRLAAHRAKDLPRIASARRAAVAAILRYERDAPDVLLMQRVERPDDRWSGQVSFPGGREEDEDHDLLATAMREVREEVGLDLAESARLLGCIDPIRAMARGKVLPMSIMPFVFLQTRAQEIEVGEEAVEAFWFPLDLAASGDIDGTYEWKLGPVNLDLPCWNYEGHTVWGLTHQMLANFLSLLRS